MNEVEKIVLLVISVIIAFLIVSACIYIVYICIKNLIKDIYELVGNKKMTLDFYSGIDEEIIKEYIPSFNAKKFKKNRINDFINIQKYWSSFNYDGLRSNLRDSLYNKYESQLKKLTSKKQRNVLEDFNPVDCKIMGINEKNGVINISIYLSISFKDYIVCGNKVVCGNPNRTGTAIYQLIFSSDKKDKICPRCGAPIDDVCEYCNFKLEKLSSDWTLSKKRVVKQELNDSKFKKIFGCLFIW